ncbi:uncharacterized protein BT62DRAFT_1008318 [Guyanagaster necrorhizus]|uniref:Uncharacterized protein n=1 Tax=Guyanagaster necrorhizus TaxID=856835 RepID=A0A9P7VNR2_9AGAR|nr:uncharacterized protein BT62DRAFT_1008318 [Guyanagaster necrorhizus MCA 3950]KAG7444114.1 hypothetical protein BT62DRAFT_1008318 [Guyanagaster necrorhizus MCA 3950]
MGGLEEVTSTLATRIHRLQFSIRPVRRPSSSNGGRNARRQTVMSEPESETEESCPPNTPQDVAAARGQFRKERRSNTPESLQVQHNLAAHNDSGLVSWSKIPTKGDSDSEAEETSTSPQDVPMPTHSLPSPLSNDDIITMPSTTAS